MRRILLSFLTLVFAAIGLIKMTDAFFSDTETSGGNILSAGAIDLKIDNKSYYGYLNEAAGTLAPSSHTTWALANLDDPGEPGTGGKRLFFDFRDLKPGDPGEDTISIHVEDNPAWVCADLLLTSNDDNTCNEPELLDDPSCTEPNNNVFDGELAGLLNFIFWRDDGDNVYEKDEVIFSQGTASQVLTNTWTIADSTTGPLDPTQTYHIGKAWCFGTLKPSPLSQGEGGPNVRGGGFTCTGFENINNASQTDILTADITFRAYQARHNPNFTCKAETPTETPTPTPIACEQADVMLVLDRSGSISNSELTSLKTAASAFVATLNPNTNGAHIGQVSFSTTGSLDLHLSDNLTAINAAISGLNNGGWTNLFDGITLADSELDDTHIHDRDDTNSPDYMIIITDGHPNRPLPSNTADDKAAAAATTAKKKGVTIFVVGVGNDVNSNYLKSIATSPAHYFFVTNYAELQNILGSLNLCQ